MLLLVLALENSAYLAVRVMEENGCQRIGLSFSAQKSHRSSMSTTTRTSTIPGGDRSRRLSVLRVPARAVTQFKGSVLAIFQFRLRARHLIATCVACFMRTCKVLIFFNFVFIPVLVFSFCGAAYIVRGQLQESAEQQVLENSRVMMQTARASRLYTTKQISPRVGP